MGHPRVDGARVRALVRIFEPLQREQHVIQAHVGHQDLVPQRLRCKCPEHKRGWRRNVVTLKCTCKDPDVVLEKEGCSFREIVNGQRNAHRDGAEELCFGRGNLRVLPARGVWLGTGGRKKEGKKKHVK